jgi:hypothetical protein
MWLPILAIWGCIPELSKDCVDMTNSSSTYLSILGGAAIGAIITWWIYNSRKGLHISKIIYCNELTISKKSIEGF